MLTGCSSNKFNAEINSFANDLVLKEFLENNKVKNAFYHDGEKYYEDESSPDNRTFIIDSNDELNEIFKENTVQVDLEKKDVYLYIFADINPHRAYIIDDIIVENKQLSIYLKLEKNDKKDATTPYQRSLFVIMDKQGCNTIKFIIV